MRKKVSFDYYVLLFFLVSFFGWGWEVVLYLVREERFVNRGILSGPWLPIYGAGGLFLYLLFSNPLLVGLLSGRRQADGRIRKPISVFLISMTVCSVLEYMAGSLLEKAWGVKWWDYSGMPFNLNGHICLMSCLMFGIGGLSDSSLFGPVPQNAGKSETGRGAAFAGALHCGCGAQRGLSECRKGHNVPLTFLLDSLYKNRLTCGWGGTI